jgi:hypothetical protein
MKFLDAPYRGSVLDIWPGPWLGTVLLALGRGIMIVLKAKQIIRARMLSLLGGEEKGGALRSRTSFCFHVLYHVYSNSDSAAYILCDFAFGFSRACRYSGTRDREDTRKPEL